MSLIQKFSAFTALDGRAGKGGEDRGEASVESEGRIADGKLWIKDGWLGRQGGHEGERGIK